MDNIEFYKPKEVALACTGGGVRAAVNIGVIRGLEELGIKITAISGASIGACVAMLYGLGYSTEEILYEYKHNINRFKKFSFLDYLLAFPNLFINGGFKNPKIISKIVKEICTKKGITNMSDFKMPVVIPGLDITKRETMYYSSKPLENLTFYSDRTVWEAIKSTCCFPFVFTPNKIKMDKKVHYMMDGGVTTNTAVVPLKQFSDFVIGIGTKFYEKDEKDNMNIAKMIKQGFQSMRRSSLREQKQSADLWIDIDVGKIGVFANINKADYLEELGYQAIKKAFQNKELFSSLNEVR